MFTEIIKAAYWHLAERNGRTFRLAIHYINKAIKNPSKWILISDHHGTGQAHLHLLDRIHTILDADAGGEFFRFKPPPNIAMKYILKGSK